MDETGENVSGLERLKRAWTAGTAQAAQIQQRIWDRAAERYGRLPIPSFSADYFLEEMARSIELSGSTRTLDIGCGSGVYSLALAQRVGRAVGVDISPNMIAYANSRARELGLDNAVFRCMDWSAADIDALGFRGAFDVVFAHMTPAIADYATFDRLNACSRNLCVLEKPTRRKDQLQDEAFRLVGLEPSGEQYHGSLPQIFTYLWHSGRCPRFFYHDEVWVSERTTEDMVQWVTDRARLRRALTPEEAAVIRGYIEPLAIDGMVLEHTTTTKVMVVWRVK